MPTHGSVAARARQHVRVRRVDDAGIVVLVASDRPVDVSVDGRRIWTFWTRRDTDAVPGLGGGPRWPVRVASWPAPLRPHLNGRARITVSDSVGDAVYFDEAVTLGERTGPIQVRNRRGVDLSIDKSGRLVPTFAGRSERDIGSLLDATESVIAALRSAGVEPFLAYGTLLGAVREGAVLGHDSDADLGYVSRHRTPVDVARESFEVQRHLAAHGWKISRYSGASFKIYVTEANVTRGLDVFAGFLSGGRLHLMGEINTPFDPAWISPLGTAHLGGRPMPVPARPEKLLEATYGSGWRVPDPAFKFTTPDHTVKTFDDWFRGTQPGLRYWEKHSHLGARRPLRGSPTPLARRVDRVARQLGAEVLDVGAGRGADSLWLARQGRTVTAYDYVPRSLEMARTRAEEEGLDLEVRHLNLTEWRSVLAEGARLAHRPRPRVIMARHVVDATSAVGRESLARLCSMALRDGGRLIAGFYLPTDEPSREWAMGRPDLESFTALLRDAGARRVKVGGRRASGDPVARVVGVW